MLPFNPISKMKKSWFCILLAAVLFSSIDAYPQLHRSRRHESLYRDNATSCAHACYGQFVHDIYNALNVTYESQYFYVPMDSLVLKGEASFKSFCTRTQEHYACLQRECQQNHHPWNANKHLCIDQLEEFKKVRPALEKTSRIVTNNCSTVCSNFMSKHNELSNQEDQYITQEGFTTDDYKAFMENNGDCLFISCNQMCHEEVIMTVKEEDSKKEEARTFVTQYYEAMLQNLLREYEVKRAEKLFSSYCRRITPGAEEEQYVANTKRYNRRMRETMKKKIKEMLMGLHVNELAYEV